jgi:hypothetical protein
MASPPSAKGWPSARSSTRTRRSSARSPGALLWLALHASRESALAKRLEEDYGYIRPSRGLKDSDRSHQGPQVYALIPVREGNPPATSRPPRPNHRRSQRSNRLIGSLRRRPQRAGQVRPGSCALRKSAAVPPAGSAGPRARRCSVSCPSASHTPPLGSTSGWSRAGGSRGPHGPEPPVLVRASWPPQQPRGVSRAPSREYRSRSRAGGPCGCRRSP